MNFVAVDSVRARNVRPPGMEGGDRTLGTRDVTSALGGSENERLPEEQSRRRVGERRPIEKRGHIEREAFANRPHPHLTLLQLNVASRILAQARKTV
jgi:hypothetical protein